MNQPFAAAVAALTLLAAMAPPARGQTDRSTPVRSVLEHLHAEQLWGEITLEAGGVRDVQVRSLQGDTVTVREVVGPLQARFHAYRLADIRAAREIGPRRIPRHLAPYRPPRSLTVALALELVLPGFGYFYDGQTGRGYALLAVSTAAAATAVATGKDGAAGWLPFMAWTKVASLAHLRDEVRAANAVHREAAEAAVLSATAPLAGLRLRF